MGTPAPTGRKSEDPVMEEEENVFEYDSSKKTVQKSI